MSSSKNHRTSIDSQFSFESHTKKNLSEEMAELTVSSPEKALNINDISLSEISNLQFNGEISDLLKLSFIKSLLIKLSLQNSNVSTSSYKSLLKDLDEDLNAKLNTMFMEGGDTPAKSSTSAATAPPKIFPTLDPKGLNSLSPTISPEPVFSKSEINKASSNEALSKSVKQPNNKIVASSDMNSTPSASLKETSSDSPYIHSNASSDYGVDEAIPKSNISSNYTSRNNSKSELGTTSNNNNKADDLNESLSRNSSIYSPKSNANNIAESIGAQSRLSNSPSATYSNKRIQLPSPRIETSSGGTARGIPSKSSLSPIAFNDIEPLRIDNSAATDINPFSERIGYIPSPTIIDPRKNKSSGSLPLNDKSNEELEKEIEKERLKRNPNRAASSEKSSRQASKHHEQPKTISKNQSAKNSPLVGRNGNNNNNVVRSPSQMYSESPNPQKMYGMGIMGLDSPAVVRRDPSPSSPKEQYDGQPKRSASGAPSTNNNDRINITNINNPRERFYQQVKSSKPVYSNYANFTNSEKRQHAKSPTLSSVPTLNLVNAGMDSKFSKSQPTTPQASSFSHDLENDASLFIQPKEIDTISLRLITSLSINKTNSSSFDPTMVFAAVDKKTGKEIWRFKKTHSQCTAFDNEMRELFDSFLLPPFPEKATYLNNLPAKVDIRRNGTLDYFSTLLNSQLPKRAVYLLCKFISTNTVNPLDDVEYNFSNEINEKDFKKHGFLIRRNKGLGANWRVRYCKCEGPNFLVYDGIDGNIVDSIRLVGAQIGRQQSDNNPEESSSNAKGYRHALLLKEFKKTSIGSSSNKHIFCAETDEERDSWINVLIEYVQDTYDNEPVELQNNLVGSGNSGGPSLSGTTLANSFSTSTLMSTPRNAHSRNKSNDLTSSLSTQHLFTGSNNQESTSPSITSPRNETWGELDESYREPKKSRKRFFGGIRNKLVNGNTTNNDMDTSTLTNASDDFQINPVTDLSSFSTTGDTSIMTTSGNTSMTNVKNDELEYHQIDRLFGNSLESAFKLSSSDYNGKKVPSIVFRCLDYLSQTGAGYQEGIFRLSGSTTMIKNLKEKFDTQYNIDLVNSEVRPEINSVTGLLKLYLRELPSSIVTSDIESRFRMVLSDYNKNLNNGGSPQLNRVKVDENNNPVYLQYMYQLKSLVHQIPRVNSDVLAVLIKYLNEEVLSRTEYNKMNLRNLVIVFSATLNIDPKILSEFFVNFDFLWEDGELINESERPNVDVGSIPLV